MTNRELARAIADDLFKNFNGDVGVRLVLVGDGGRDLGGWFQGAMIGRIELILNREKWKEVIPTANQKKKAKGKPKPADTFRK